MMKRGLQKRTPLRGPMFCPAALFLVLLSFAVSTEAQPRAFTTCRILGLAASSVIDPTETAPGLFCDVVTVAEDGSAGVTISSTTVGGGTTSGGFSITAGPDSGSASAVLSFEGTTFEATASSPEDAITTSTSDLSLCIPAVGGDPDAFARAEALAAGDTDFQLEVIPALSDAPRPEGPWFTIVAISTAAPDADGLFTELDNGGVFELGLEGRATVVEGPPGTITLTSRAGFSLVLVETGRDDVERYIVYEVLSADAGLFPGFDFTGTRIYVQAREDGLTDGATSIEIGWGPASIFDLSVGGGDLATGIELIEALFFEIQAALEAIFGNLCTFAKNTRTIEGDCNNLDFPEQASAAIGLRRLGGTDPAYPGGDPNIPSGPTDISPRLISNNLFTTSPGISVLEGNAASLEGVVLTVTVGATDFTLDVLASLEFGGTVVPFTGFGTNECEDLILQYTSDTCVVDIRLKCAGVIALELEEDPCGALTNRLFHPAGCVLEPARDEVLENPEGLTDLFFTFAQFIDHDYGLSPLSQINANQPGFGRLGRDPNFETSFPIDIPEGDFFFPGRPDFEFTRAEMVEGAAVPTQVNIHSSYLDGSQIYGVDFIRARLLRAFVGGELTLSPGDFPPFNGPGGVGFVGFSVENGPNPAPEFFVAGDPRSNEQILLQVMHVLFLREHNLIAQEVAAAFPNLDDELIYQTARCINIAQYQCIVYKEWLPLLLGTAAPDPDAFVYDPTLDATVSTIFTTSSFRFGHSLVPTNLLRLGPGPKATADMELIPVRDAFFAPEVFGADGIDPFARGGAWHLCKELDNKIVDELRTFLTIDFEEGVVNPPLFDLMALNIQRARDLGLPQFNDIRVLFDLPAYTAFTDFVNDPSLADVASNVYRGEVDLVDSFFGGMVEPEVNGGQLGQTFSVINADQFRRSRDGDRFFYTGLTFSQLLIDNIPRVQAILDGTCNLGDVILRTTGVTAAELKLDTRPSVFQRPV